MNEPPPRSAQSRAGQRILFWLACAVLVVVMIWLGLNESGRSAWDNYRRQWEAKGEKFDFASFIPKPVPDDQNFAMAPIVAASYKANLLRDREYVQTTAYQTGSVNRTIKDPLNLRIDDDDLVARPTNGLGHWTKGMLSDLQPWQNYYRALSAKTNFFPAPPQPHSPAADVLLALGKYESAIEELRSAALRPVSRFPLNYEADPPTIILLPHLTTLKRCSQAVQLRAIAELQNGQAQQALDDIKLILQLTHSIRTEPFLISHLVRIAMVQMAMQPIWEGLMEHKWSDAQLIELDQELARLDFPADYEFSMRGERALSIASIEHLRRYRDFDQTITVDGPAGTDQDRGGSFAGRLLFHLIPASLFYRNELAIARMHQQYLLPIVDARQHIASPDAARRTESAIEKMRARWSPNNVLACMMLPALANTVKKFAYAQSSVDLARVACALERYRRVHGEFPETLDAIAPPFLESIPHDIIDGQPLHYRPTHDGNFLLYSVGWNGTDDGGTVVLAENGRNVDTMKGDWVWPGQINGTR